MLGYAVIKFVNGLLLNVDKPYKVVLDNKGVYYSVVLESVDEYAEFRIRLCNDNKILLINLIDCSNFFDYSKLISSTYLFYDDEILEQIAFYGDDIFMITDFETSGYELRYLVLNNTPLLCYSREVSHEYQRVNLKSAI